MSSPTYDAYRQVFSLSMLANRASNYTGSLEALRDQLQLELSAFLTVTATTPAPMTPDPDYVAEYGAWEVVWGPAGWQDTEHPVHVLDNAIFVAHRPGFQLPGEEETRDVWVVATCATNPASFYDWLTEDAKVGSAVYFDDWNPFVTEKAFPTVSQPVNAGMSVISMGTAIGVGTLLTIYPPDNAAGTNATLISFLAGLPTSGSTNPTIIFCGHSLAGALSPTLALWLKKNGHLDQFTDVLVYPSAGATPGNMAFANAFADTFPARPAVATDYRGWNQDMRNRLDVVPHAWELDTMGALKTLYGNPEGKAPLDVKLMVDGATDRSEKSGVFYTMIQGVWLAGDIFHRTPDGDSLTVPPNDVTQYLDQLFQQHVTAYVVQPDPNHPDSPPGAEGLVLAEPMPCRDDIPLLPGVHTLGRRKDPCKKRNPG